MWKRKGVRERGKRVEYRWEGRIDRLGGRREKVKPSTTSITVQSPKFSLHSSREVTRRCVSLIL